MAETFLEKCDPACFFGLSDKMVFQKSDGWCVDCCETWCWSGCCFSLSKKESWKLEPCVLYWFVLERTLSVATRNFEIGVFVIFYLVFGFGPKVLALDLQRKHTAVLCKFVRINFQVFYGVTFIWVMEWCSVVFFALQLQHKTGFNISRVSHKLKTHVRHMLLGLLGFSYSSKYPLQVCNCQFFCSAVGR